jgi:hypothetical protein
MHMRWTAISGACLVLTACGGSNPAPAAPVESTAQGDEQPLLAEEESAPEPEEEEVSQEPAVGPAKLTVIAKVAGQEAPAQVTVRDEQGNVLAQGKAGQVLDVQSGLLSIEASITDAAALVDKPTMLQEVSVEPGGDAKEVLNFAYAKVRVSVNIKGKLDKTATVTLSKDGSPVVKLASGASEYVTISPGRYEASVKSQRADVSVPPLVIMEGATMDIPLNVN